MQMKIRQGLLKPLLILAGVLLLVALFFVLLSHWESHYGKTDSDAFDSSDDGRLYLNDVCYAPKKDLETILLIGVDKFDNQTQDSSYNNSQQADFLMLLVMDMENKSCTALHLNRDTMTEIPVLGVRGESAGSITGQLALAHTYGSGGADSCRNTLKAVKGLLYGQNIDHYVSFTMDAVGEVNDLAGGITLTMLDDLSSAYPEMQQGAAVTLTGDMALAYVRTRYGLEDSSNLRRMERQRQYLTALYKAVSEKESSDETFLMKALETISAYMVSDCTVDQLSRLYDCWEACESKDFCTVDGVAEKGAEFMEFYPDEAALKQFVVDLFYTPVEE